MWLTQGSGRPREVVEADLERANGEAAEDQPSTAELEDRITLNSPDGRPEHLEIGARGLFWLIVAPIGALLVLAAVVFFIWGLAAAALVFVFGTALACFGNPEVWATYLRARERDEIEHPEHRKDRTT